MLVVAEDEDPFEKAREGRQTVRRSQAMADAVGAAFSNTVTDAHGPNIMKISFKEWEDMKNDPAVETFAQYGPNLLFLSDESGLPDFNKPRDKPLRPILGNEVGTWHHKEKGAIILHLKDAGPGDYGSGPYFQVSKDAPVPSRDIHNVDRTGGGKIPSEDGET